MRTGPDCWWMGVLSALVLASCGRASDSALDGRYVLPNGRTVVFQGSNFRANSAMSDGSVLLSGTAITVRLINGTQLQGERIDTDHIRFTKQNGALIPPLELVREGTNAAASVSTPTAPAPPRAAAEPAPAFSPDASVQLSAYTPLHTKTDLAWVVAAFQTVPLDDDQLLAAFASQPSALKDAFAKRDLAARELPALRGHLEQTHEQRYYAVEFGVPAKDPVPDTFQVYSRFLEPYDFERHAFPLLVMGDAPCWDFIGPLRVTETKGACALTVTDETQARRIESERSTLSTLYTKGTVFFCVTHDAVAGHPASVTVMRTHLTVALFTDPHFSYSGEF